MYWKEIKRISLMSGFILGILTFAWNLFSGLELLYAVYMFFVVLLLSSIVIFLALQFAGRVLTNFLVEQQQLAMEVAEKEKSKQLENKAPE